MTAIVLYGLKTCDTCRKALAALETAGHAVTYTDIRADTDLAAKVPAWLAALGPDPLVNRRSTTWRSLTDAEKHAADGAGAAALLIANPTLIKRPVIERGEEVFVGWTKDVAAAVG